MGHLTIHPKYKKPYKAYVFKRVHRVKGPNVDLSKKWFDCMSCAATALNMAYNAGRTNLAPEKISPARLEKYKLAEADNKEYEALFKLQHKRMRTATRRWRKANPGNDLVQPDLGALLGWMLGEMKRR